MNRTILSLLACSLVGSTALAQPTTSDDSGGAKSLMASGVKLFTAKDYLGALVVFKDAYSRFASAKILLNIATTLSKLDRKAEAANAYQRYLDAADSDPAKHAGVRKALAELDKDVGLVALSVTPAGAEVEIGDEGWVPATDTTRLRVPATEVIVRARKAGFQPGEKRVVVATGTTQAIAIALTAIPETTPTGTGTGSPTGTGVSAVLAPERPRSRFGVLALGHFDLSHNGGAALVGVTADVTNRFQVQVAALLGPTSGAYAGASFALLTGSVRPILAAGLPLFISGGARIGIRGAGGVELRINRHIALIAELGVERILNAEANVAATLFVPAVGAAGRL